MSFNFGLAYEILGAYEQAQLAALAAETVPLAAGAGVIIGVAAPVTAMVLVAKALGSGYGAAREAVKGENTMSGFYQGLVMGILDWEWRHVVNRFYRHNALRIHVTDEALNVIRVGAYNRGLFGGYAFGRAFPPDLKSSFLSKIRELTPRTQVGGWTQREQISYVIELAAALRKQQLPQY